VEILKTSRESAPPSTNNQELNSELNNDKKEMLLSSFVGDSTSSKVDIVFSFDTTGSMISCLKLVREKISMTVRRLMEDIKDIRIGIIAHGDYGDDWLNYTVRKLDLTNNVNKICKFVNTVPSTSGDDPAEAYELVLRDAYNLSWREDSSKALVVIGDDVPHPPSFTDQRINWFDCLDRLIEKKIKVYGVRALNEVHAIPFYEELSSRSGAVSIHFNNFNLNC